jgi:hypothetical protein
VRRGSGLRQPALIAGRAAVPPSSPPQHAIARTHPASHAADCGRQALGHHPEPDRFIDGLGQHSTFPQVVDEAGCCQAPSYDDGSPP